MKKKDIDDSKYVSRLVSVIMPAYNSASTIIEAINSVIRQTYMNWELIVVDDSSSDNTKSLIEEICAIDERIKPIYLENNKGVANARNVAIEKANGQYIAFLDSDDVWFCKKLAKQIDFMYNNNIAMSYTTYCYMTYDGEDIDKIIKVPDKTSYKDLLINNNMGCLTVVIDRNFYDKIVFEKIGHEDYLTWLQILKSGIVAYGVDELLAKYRISKTSLSGNKFQAAKWHWNILRKHEKIGFFKAVILFIRYSWASISKHYV